MNRFTARLSAIVAVAFSGALVFACAGLYNVAADEPHWQLTRSLLAVIRDRSIAVQSSQLEAPNLADPELIARGAEQYASMCACCHRAPGTGDSVLRQGLNPRPPDLSMSRERSPAETFWVVKHGLKWSGMPAWGPTHDDASVWSIVAFVQQLPMLTETEYVALSGSGHVGARDDGPRGREARGGIAGGTAASSGATIDTEADDSHARAQLEGAQHDH